MSLKDLLSNAKEAELFPDLPEEEKEEAKEIGKTEARRLESLFLQMPTEREKRND